VSSTGTSRRVKTNSRVPFTTVLQLPDLQFAIALHAISSDLDALPARSRPDLSSALRVPVSGRPARIGNGLAPFLPPLLGPLNHLEIMECWVRRIILGFTACGVSDLTLSADCSLSAEEEQAVCNCGHLRVSLCEHASLSKQEPMGRLGRFHGEEIQGLSFENPVGLLAYATYKRLAILLHELSQHICHGWMRCRYPYVYSSYKLLPRLAVCTCIAT
jgi:hypothetical protein